MKELLVPVGSMESLYAAINNGADAVYLGGKRFGARAYADNFSMDELSDAIKIAHLYGVKIYVTVNTLIHESEVDEVINYVRFLHKNSVDAIIVQDIGLISLIRETYPNLEIHASTQVHTTNIETIKLLEELGVKRVVVARELSIDTITSFDTNLEIEAFIHGALCVSYSGECLFSSIVMNRSGNRGECAQMCRLPFKLMKDDEEINTDGEYLLSTKELNTSEYFKKIMESNIYSLKIEGRMKGADYVACVTRLYRDLMDKYYNGDDLVVNEEYLNDLKKIFNRDYTKGFLFNATNKELMNIKTSNHQGVKIGEVIDVDEYFITIKLCGSVNQGDGIRFLNNNEGMMLNYIYDKNGLLINSSDTIIKVKNRCNTRVSDIVNKTFDVLVNKKYLNSEAKRIGIDISFEATNNEPMKLTFSDGVNKVSVLGSVAESSINAPATKELVEKQLVKLGETIYKQNNVSINIDDNLFIRNSELNDLRRQACIQLNEMRTYNIPFVENSYNDVSEITNTSSINILVRNEDQLKYLLDKGVSIIVPNKKLYDKYKTYDNVYYRESRVGENLTDERVVATELGGIKKAVMGDYYLNVTNHYSLDYLSKYLRLITLSVELSDEEIKEIMNHRKYNVEIFLYGRLELMLTKYCPLNLNVNKDTLCHVCAGDELYYLVDRNNYKYLIMNDPVNHITHIMDNKVTNKISKINDYRKMGINNFRIELIDENIDEIDGILKEVME